MVRVCFCLDGTFNPQGGGIASVSLAVSKGLRDRDIDCYFVSIHDNGFEHDNNQFFLPNAVSGAYNVENKEWFCRFIKENEINYVINQNGTTPFSDWPVEWGNELGVKVITVYHSSLFGMFSFQKLRNNGNIVSRILHIKETADYTTRRFFKLKYGRYFRKQVEKSWKIVTLSDKFFSEIDWYSGLDDHSKYVAIPNVVITKSEHGKEYPKEKVVIFVGRLSPEKQPNLLLNIWKTVVQSHMDWSLRLIGAGAMDKSLKEKVNKEGIKNVYFEGFQNPEKYYENASIICMTSSFEGFGLVLVEAMNYGVVPMAFNSYKNASEIINDGITGYLVKPFSISEYIEKLSILIDNAELRSEMSQNSIKKADSFSERNIIPLWMELLK